MHQVRKQGESCYVHCKTGRERSWTIVMAYLLKYADYNTSDLAQVHIKLCRDQVSPSQLQVDYIKSLETYLGEFQSTDNFKPATLNGL